MNLIYTPIMRHVEGMYTVVTIYSYVFKIYVELEQVTLRVSPKCCIALLTLYVARCLKSEFIVAKGSIQPKHQVCN